MAAAGGRFFPATGFGASAGWVPDTAGFRFPANDMVNRCLQGHDTFCHGIQRDSWCHMGSQPRPPRVANTINHGAQLWNTTEHDRTTKPDNAPQPPKIPEWLSFGGYWGLTTEYLSKGYEMASFRKRSTFGPDMRLTSQPVLIKNAVLREHKVRGFDALWKPRCDELSWLLQVLALGGLRWRRCVGFRRACPSVKVYSCCTRLYGTSPLKKRCCSWRISGCSSSSRTR